MLDAVVVSAPYSPEQEERIREAVEELCDRIGVQMAAGKLCTTEPALGDLLAGRRPPKPMLVGLLAKQHGETIEQLLDPKRPKKAPIAAPEAPAPAAAVSPALAAPPVAPPPVSTPLPLSSPMANAPPLIAPPPAMDPTVAGPAVAFEQPPPGGPSFIAPVAAPIAEPASPVEATDSGSAEPRLTLIEYASVSMGLELLPHREADVLAHFGLRDPNVRQRETDHWTAHLKASARDRREFPAMRERMRMYWMRFDGQAVSAPVSSSQNEPVEPRASMPTPKPVPIQAPPPPPISLEAYAALCVELHRSPATAENTFAYYGLNDPASREHASRYWTERFGIYPSERAEWERLYHAKAQELAARVSHVPAAPMPNQYVAALKAPGDHAAPPTMSLNAYALLCVELEKKPKEREQVYKRHGLADPQKRRLAEEGWGARLERDPAERARWQQLTDEIRADWMDF